MLGGVCTRGRFGSPFSFARKKSHIVETRTRNLPRSINSLKPHLGDRVRRSIFILYVLACHAPGIFENCPNHHPFCESPAIVLPGFCPRVAAPLSANGLDDVLSLGFHERLLVNDKHITELQQTLSRAWNQWSLHWRW